MRIKYCCWYCKKQYNCPFSYPDHPPDCEMDSTWCSSVINIDYGKAKRHTVYYCPAYECVDFEPMRAKSKTKKHR